MTRRGRRRLRVERLAQTVQADVFHLFSIGEGIAYGSSVINYVISGSPVSAFKVELSAEYSNVEFTGKDVRAWPKVDGGYLVQLHTPVSGPYTLLATYERAFKPQGETLAFTGRAAAGRAVGAGAHHHHQHVSISGEARGCFDGAAAAGTGRSAGGIPAVF